MKNVEIGTIYEDPEGMWMVERIDDGQADVRYIDEGLNKGKVFSVSLEEVSYWMNNKVFS